jgi:Ni,Fe-hydrogenase maturation factor
MDSDGFFPKLNFMMSMKEEKFTGIIPMGTAIAQLIPFKREKWSSVIIDDAARSGVDNGSERKIIDSKLAKVFSGAYKKFFWSKKDFR